VVRGVAWGGGGRCGGRWEVPWAVVGGAVDGGGRCGGRCGGRWRRRGRRWWEVLWTVGGSVQGVGRRRAPTLASSSTSSRTSVARLGWPCRSSSSAWKPGLRLELERTASRRHTRREGGSHAETPSRSSASRRASSVATKTSAPGREHTYASSSGRKARAPRRAPPGLSVPRRCTPIVPLPLPSPARFQKELAACRYTRRGSIGIVCTSSVRSRRCIVAARKVGA
jgi:hypothetical protein